MPRYEPRFKMIRYEKSLDSRDFIEDVNRIPFSLVYAVSDPNEKLSIFYSLLLEVIDRHAPYKRIKVTRPPAPWIRDPEIKKLQNLRNSSRFEAHKSHDSSIWDTFRLNKRDIKRAIRQAKSGFYRNALFKKKPKEVWKIIHSVLHPPPKRCTFSPSELNNYFVEIAGKILNKEQTQPSKILDFIESLPNSSRENGAVFQLHQVTYENLLKQLKALRNDTSTGPDGIPCRYIKLVQDSSSSPLTHIINAFIETVTIPLFFPFIFNIFFFYRHSIFFFIHFIRSFRLSLTTTFITSFQPYLRLTLVVIPFRHLPLVHDLVFCRIFSHRSSLYHVSHFPVILNSYWLILSCYSTYLLI